MKTFNSLLLLCLMLMLGCGKPSTTDSVSENAADPAAKPVELRDAITLVNPPTSPNAIFSLLVTDVGASEKFWLAVDGEQAYIDRNSDGQFGSDENVVAEKGDDRRVFSLGRLGKGTFELSFETTSLKRTINELQPDFVASQINQEWALAQITRIDNQDTLAIPVWMTKDLNKARVAHLNGRLQFALKLDDLVLEKDQPTKFEVKAMVSELTNKAPERRSEMPVFTKEVDDSIAPVAVFRFASDRPDSVPIEQVVNLDQRC